MTQATDKQLEALRAVYKFMPRFPNWPSEVSKELGINAVTLKDRLLAAQEKGYCIYTSNGIGRTPSIEFTEKFRKDHRL